MDVAERVLGCHDLLTTSCLEVEVSRQIFKIPNVTFSSNLIVLRKLVIQMF